MCQLLDDNGQTYTTEQYFHDDEHGAPAAAGGTRAGPAAAAGARAGPAGGGEARAAASKKYSKDKQAAVPKMINAGKEEEYAQDADGIYILGDNDRAVIDMICSLVCSWRAPELLLEFQSCIMTFAVV
jgi:hypothetical protein